MPPSAPTATASVDNDNQKNNHPIFDAEHFPIMAMIDNSPEARASHSGLTAAAIVYETLVEGGATRLAALFAGAPAGKRIGPIRSIRPVFVDIAASFRAVVWHAGGSPEALAQIRNAPVYDFNEISYLGPRYFWRDRQIARPHNLFTDGERITAALTVSAPKLKQDIGFWQWGEMPCAASSSPATALAVDFSPGVIFDIGYNYDAEQGSYARIMALRPHVDRGASRQITTDNVIIQKVPVEGYYRSGYGRLIINIIGEGEALFFRDGRAFSGKWRKESRASQTEWLDEAGAPFILKPGTVWVEIVPGRREVKYQ